MGSGIPMLTAREVVGILQALGFVLIRQKGSHQQFRHPDGRGTTVPFHSGDISPILLKQIAKDIQVPLTEFLEHR